MNVNNPPRVDKHVYLQGIYPASTKKNAPIDNHHPNNPKTSVYYFLGGRLTEAHIGKRVVRAYPLEREDDYDWSSVPEDSSKEAAERNSKIVLSVGEKVTYYFREDPEL